MAHVKDPLTIWSGDIIGLQLDSLGLMSLPPFNEPIPESEETVPHLRVSKGKKFSTADYRRSSFRIENDLGLKSEIIFGAIVKLSHYPTGLVLIGSDVADKGYGNGDLRCLFLATSDSLSLDDLSYKWVITPRYNLREEGDPVKKNDFVFLRNAQHKHLYLTSFKVSEFNTSQDVSFEHLVGLSTYEEVSTKLGAQINLFRKCPLQLDDDGGGGAKKGKKKKKGKKQKKKKKKPQQNKTEEEEEEERLERSTVFSGDYIRVMHREYQGHLICRPDDNAAFQSVITPLGSVARKFNNLNKDSTHAVFLRTLAAQHPREQLDFPNAFSSLGVWQILAADQMPATEQAAAHGMLKFNGAVRLRHLVSGQYLSVRPKLDTDTHVLKAHSSFEVKRVEDERKRRQEEEKAKDRKLRMMRLTAGRQKKLNLTKADVDMSDSENDGNNETPLSDDSMSVSTASGTSNIKHKKLTKNITEETGLEELEKQQIHIFVSHIAVDNLNNIDWAGKHFSGLHLKYGHGSQAWQYRTRSSSTSGNFASWEFDKADNSLHFVVNKKQLTSAFLEVKVMRINALSGELPLGQGRVLLPPHLGDIGDGEVLDCTLDIFDYKHHEYAGSVTLELHKNVSITPEDEIQMEEARKQLANIEEGSEPDLGDATDSDMEEDQLADQIKKVDWVIGTSAVADRFTKFNLIQVDIDLEEALIVNYNERLAFEHSFTKMRLKMSSLLDLPNPQKDVSQYWWEYQSDMPLAPCPADEDAIIDSEVCQIERVDTEEISDIFYASRFVALAKACTLTLQLTPKSHFLYFPMFRHFQKSLQSLTLWVVGEADTDAVLCADVTGSGELDANALAQAEAQKAADEAFQEAMENSEFSEGFLLDDRSSAASQSSHHEGDSEVESKNADWKKREVRFDEVHHDTSDLVASAVAVSSDSVEAPNSMSPWLGRYINRSQFSAGATADLGINTTPLEQYTSWILETLVSRDVTMNETMLRRQVIVAESYMLEICAHFLNILFLLQRAVTLTMDDDIFHSYPGTPRFLFQCCNQIHRFMRAMVLRNEKVALKLISVHGSFLSMISQKIIGWEPPIEAILNLTCKSHSDSEKSAAPGNQSGGVESILVNAISASDILQIVKQMHELHLNADPAATQILRLLTLLCNSGRAARHFQSLLINTIAANDITEYCLSGEYLVKTRDSALQEISMLFYTRYEANQWQVKFRYPFAFPSQEEKNQELLKRKIKREATCLKDVFSQYNDDDDAADNVLDISESFRLLEDLCLGGPFLFKEIRFMESCTILGFMNWWCYRSCFYFPASSISHCQMSPIQAMVGMGTSVTAGTLTAEMERSTIDSGTVSNTIDFLEVINSRLLGFSLNFYPDDDEWQEIQDLNVVRHRHSTINDNSPDVKKLAAQFSSKMVHTNSLAMQDIVRDRSSGEGRWMEFSLALDKSCKDRAWFRLALQLLAECCSGSNPYSQRIASILVPPECLLAALKSGFVANSDKALLLRFLSTVYVEHDLVYPTRFFPFHNEVHYCGQNEEILNPAVAIGKLFNSLSRAKFHGDGAEDGATLRMMLFRYLSQHIMRISLFSRSHSEISYSAALLKLFQLLFKRGFFQEPEFEFFTNRETAVNAAVTMEPPPGVVDKVSSAVGLPTRNYWAERPRSISNPSKGTEAGTDKTAALFTLDAVQNMLVRKLNEMKLHHQCTRDFSGLVHDDEEYQHNSNDKSYELRHLDSKTPTTASTAHSLARRRRNFDSLKLSFAYFDTLHVDARNCNLMNNVINVLTQIHDTKQSVRLQKCWNFIGNAVDAVVERAYSKPVEDLRHYLPKVQFESFYQNAFQVFRHHEPVPGYTQAIFLAAVYDNFELREKCFALLNRQLCIVRDAEKILSSLILLPDAHEALVYRLLTVYQSHLRVFVKDVLSTPFPTRMIMLEKVNFTLENIRALCFSNFLDRLNKGDQRKVVVPPSNSSKARKAKRITAKAGKSIPSKLYKPEQDRMAYLLPLIPCPSGDDEFFELDLEELVASDTALNELCLYYELFNQEVLEGDWMEKAKIDVEKTMTSVCTDVISIMIQAVQSPDVEKRMIGESLTVKQIGSTSNAFLPWDALYSSEKYVFDRLLELLAAVGFNSRSMCDSWFPAISGMLLEYFPESIAAGKLVIVFLRNCKKAHPAANGNTSSFAERSLHAILDNGLINTHIYSQSICALLDNPRRHTVEFAGDFFLSHIRAYALHIDFRMVPEQLFGDVALRNDLYHVLLPISKILSLKVKMDIPDAVLSAIKVVFSEEFCRSFLSSPHTPLVLKSTLIPMALSLYQYQQIKVEDILLADLRRMRIAYSLEMDTDILACSEYCMRFLADVLYLLKRRIIESGIVPCSTINALVMDVIDNAAESSAPNMNVARKEADVLKTLFSNNFLDEKRYGNSASGDNIDNGGVSDEHKMLSLSIFQGLMLTLNIFRLKFGKFAADLDEDQRCEVAWLCAAAAIFLDNHSSCIIDPKFGQVIDVEADIAFPNVIKRCLEILRGSIAEVLALRVEKRIRSFYSQELVAFALETFRDVAWDSPRKASLSLLKSTGGLFFGEDDLEKARFERSMSVSVIYPIEYLTASPLFRFLRDSLSLSDNFVEKGGSLLFGDWRSPLVKSKAFAKKFSWYTDFDLWMKGQGRVFACLFKYLARVTDPQETEFNLLHMTTALLANNIESLRESKFLSLNLRLSLIEIETKRLSGLQVALKDLGALELVIRLLGRCNANASDNFVWKYAPLALGLANSIIAWQNDECQEFMLELIEDAIAKKKPPEMSSLVGLQYMIRRCNLEIAYSPNIAAPSSIEGIEKRRVKVQHQNPSDASATNNTTWNYRSVDFPDSDQTRILRSVKQLFVFVGTFCKGDNTAAQAFFSAYQTPPSKLYVDLVQELALLANSVITKFCGLVQYIGSEGFNDRIAPIVWEAKDTSKRQFLAWHSPLTHLGLFTQYLCTFTFMMDSLLSIACDFTAIALQQAIIRCPDLIEFFGVMQLETYSYLQAVNGLGIAVLRPVRWHCNDPFHTYRLYVREMQSAELLSSDEDSEEIQKSMQLWLKLRTSKLVLPETLGGSGFGSKDYTNVFGVSQALFSDFIRKAEGKCLTVILAFFEFAPQQNANDISGRFNDGILMQNMDNSFRMLQTKSSGDRELYSSTTVSYISLLESIGLSIPECIEMLDGWKIDAAKRGYDPKTVFGVVEIIGKLGKTQRLYFPIPAFVTTFWLYPEVQKLKNHIVLKVVRTSPEEKLGDFLDWMDKITQVMKRQESLRRLLTYPLHAFFGGKTSSYAGYIPRQRQITAFLTLCFNIYYCYYTSLPERFSPPDKSYAKYLLDWNLWGRVFNLIEIVYVGLNISLTLTALLNSYALDGWNQLIQTESFWLTLILKILTIPVMAWLLFVDILWPLSMLASAFIAIYFDLFWFYAFNLLDIVFQVQYMKFVFDAITVNGSKIMYTMLLAFLCLYYYAVIATLYLNGQFNINDHYGCNNIVSCFKLHLDYGIENTPNFEGPFYIDPEIDEFDFLYGPLLARILGTVYSVSYVILINLVLQSIISGLIIDTFAQLREENESIVADIGDKCFICSILRDDFEQAGISFREHIKDEHNMWHYVWFKIYLQSKDPLTFTSAENYAFETFSDKTAFIQTMPIKKSVSLEKKLDEDDAAEKLEEQLEEMLTGLTKLQSQQYVLTKLAKVIKKTSSRVEQQLQKAGNLPAHRPPASVSQKR